jgi:hypothetical protein
MLSNFRSIATLNSAPMQAGDCGEPLMAGLRGRRYTRFPRIAGDV